MGCVFFEMERSLFIIFFSSLSYQLAGGRSLLLFCAFLPINLIFSPISFPTRLLSTEFSRSTEPHEKQRPNEVGTFKTIVRISLLPLFQV